MPNWCQSNQTFNYLRLFSLEFLECLVLKSSKSYLRVYFNDNKLHDYQLRSSPQHKRGECQSQFISIIIGQPVDILFLPLTHNHDSSVQLTSESLINVGITRYIQDFWGVSYLLNFNLSQKTCSNILLKQFNILQSQVNQTLTECLGCIIFHHILKIIFL